MNGLLIANKDEASREQMADLFCSDGYEVTCTDSVVNSLEGILDKSIQVVLLGGIFDEQQIAKFVPLLKKCNRNLSIILVSDEMPLELLRRIRKEGIFYHALKPVGGESWDEIRQAVSCAFENYQTRQSVGRRRFGTKIPARGAAAIMTCLTMMLMFAPRAMAVDTSHTYNSGILTLLFVGFCALLIVAQLVPAVLMLFGLTKDAAQGRRDDLKAVAVRKC